MSDKAVEKFCPAELCESVLNTLDVTAPQLAKALGVTRNTIYLWLRGERSIAGPTHVLLNLLMSDISKKTKKRILSGEFSEFLN